MGDRNLDLGQQGTQRKVFSDSVLLSMIVWRQSMHVHNPSFLIRLILRMAYAELGRRRLAKRPFGDHNFWVCLSNVRGSLKKERCMEALGDALPPPRMRAPPTSRQTERERIEARQRSCLSPSFLRSTLQGFLCVVISGRSKWELALENPHKRKHVR